MKTQKVRLLIILLIGQAFLMQGLIAQQEVKKEFHETYKADKNTRLVLDNQYGDIDIKDWDHSQVKVDIIVNVKQSNPEKAKKLLDLIDVKFDVEGNDIKITTEFDDEFRKTSNWRDDEDLSIDYTIQMPSYIGLDVTNKYGDVFISEVTGPAMINVKYGNLKANRIIRGNEKPLSQINLGYSNADIEEADWLKADIKYAKLTINKMQALVLVSKYSKVYIDEASSIVSEGGYDTYKFGKLNNFVTITKYSTIEIAEVSDKLNCESSYSDCKVDHVPPEFKSIEIENRYGGYRIGIDETASYQLDGYAEYAGISYHDEGNISRISENTKLTVSGTVGKDSSSEATVKVNTKYGSVKLDY